MSNTTGIAGKYAEVSRETSQRIYFLSFVCAVFVVWLHCSKAPSDFKSVEYLIYAFLQNCVVEVAVPFFFVVSGFFLAGKTDSAGWWRRETKKRCTSLLLPFLYWNLFSILFLNIVLTCGANLVHGNPILKGTVVLENRGIFDFPLVMLWKHPYNGNTWYLRSLFLLVLFSPIFKFALEKVGALFLLGTFSIYAGSSSWVPQNLSSQFWDLFSLQGLFFFSVGMFLRMKPICISKFHIATALSLFVVTSALICWQSRTGSSFHCLGISPIPFMLVGGVTLLWRFAPILRLPKILIGSSFFIYLFHHPMIFVVGIAEKRLEALFGTGLLISCVNFACVFALTLCGWFVLLRFPKIRATALGGR